MVVVVVAKIVHLEKHPRNLDATERKRTRKRIRKRTTTVMQRLLRVTIQRLTNRQRRKVASQRDPRQRKKRINKVAAVAAAKPNRSINKASNKLYPSLVVNNNHSSQPKAMKPNPRATTQVLLDVPVKYTRSYGRGIGNVPSCFDYRTLLHQVDHGISNVQCDEQIIC